MALLMLTKKEAIIIVDRLSRCVQTFYMPRISRTVATCHEWKGIKPPKGGHWRSDPNVLEQLDNDVLIKWSANGVLRKKYTLMKKTERKSNISGNTKTPSIRHPLRGKTYT